jgi:acyl-CoA synthetase (AMP-forming)/AMP-acid ligase II
MTAFAVDRGSVPEDIRAVSRSYPHSVALIHGDRQLSYEELDRRADQFAAYLAQLGVRAGDTVAICMERSLDWIVAVSGLCGPVGVCATRCRMAGIAITFRRGRLGCSCVCGSGSGY